MSQAVNCHLFLYAHDTCLVCQHKDTNIIDNQLNEDFWNICDWFVVNKLLYSLVRIRQNQCLLLLNLKGKI